MNIPSYSFQGPTSGLALAIVGAIHGNEQCGPAAINRLIRDIDDKKIILKRGTLWLMPIANPLAYERDVRFVERNLNRSLFRKDVKVHYEDHIDPILCDFLDHADILLDLHSYLSGTTPFIFLDSDNPDEIAFARAQNVQDYICGWSSAFSDSGTPEATTEDYMRSNGKIAITLECGQHKDPNAANVGYEGIIRALMHLNMLDSASSAAQPYLATPCVDAVLQRCVKMQKVYRFQEGAVFAKEWKNLDKVVAGEPIATLNGENLYAAPAHGYMILPKRQVKHGDEWIYFGIDSNFPDSTSPK